MATVMPAILIAKYINAHLTGFSINYTAAHQQHTTPSQRLPAFPHQLVGDNWQTSPYQTKGLL